MLSAEFIPKGDKIKVVFGLSGREGKSRDGNTVYYTIWVHGSWRK